jgi:hypothetical protein
MTATKLDLGAVCREGRGGDIAFVVDSWLKSYRAEQPDMLTRDYMPWQRARINFLLGRAGLFVAHPAAESTVIWSWLICEPGVIHYAYTKPDAKGAGLVRQLLAFAGLELPCNVSHMTADGRRIKGNHDGQLRYIPL